MESTWYETERNHPELIPSGDIGGTNANFAVVGYRDGNFDVIAEYQSPSKSVTSGAEIVRTIFEDFESTSGRKPTRICISAAGAVRNNRCKPTNLDWEIDGDAVSSLLRIPTLVINDFQGLCFALPLLDVNDPKQIIPVLRPGGNPGNTGSSWAVAGAGTGLGVGYLIRVGDSYLSIPSGGGHTLFAAFDEETRALLSYVTRRLGGPPRNEDVLSGRGMAAIFNFFRDEIGITQSTELKEIDSVPDTDKPPLITRYIGVSEECTNMMRLFVRIYARFASSVALYFLPWSGIYIAGGIVARLSSLFLDEDLFIRHFDRHENADMLEKLQSIPVYLINDYSISLLGAANAALYLM